MGPSQMLTQTVQAGQFFSFWKAVICDVRYGQFAKRMNARRREWNKSRQNNGNDHLEDLRCEAGRRMSCFRWKNGLLSVSLLLTEKRTSNIVTFPLRDLQLQKP